MQLDVFSFITQLFTPERLMTLALLIVAIVVWELTKKAVRKTIGYTVQHKWKAAFIWIIVALAIILIIYLRW